WAFESSKKQPTNKIRNNNELNKAARALPYAGGTVSVRWRTVRIRLSPRAPCPSDVAVQRETQIGLEVGSSRRPQDVLHPSVALVTDQEQIPDAGIEPRRRHVPQSVRASRFRAVDMVMQLVLVGPPVHEDEVACPAGVNADKTDAVVP